MHGLGSMIDFEENIDVLTEINDAGARLDLKYMGIGRVPDALCHVTTGRWSRTDAARRCRLHSSTSAREAAWGSGTLNSTDRSRGTFLGQTSWTGRTVAHVPCKSRLHTAPHLARRLLASWRVRSH